MNEIEIMKTINHDYIMKLEELHESKNSVYLVLELLEGGELFNHISSKQNLDLKKKIRLNLKRFLIELLISLTIYRE